MEDSTNIEQIEIGTDAKECKFKIVRTTVEIIDGTKLLEIKKAISEKLHHINQSLEDIPIQVKARTQAFETEKKFLEKQWDSFQAAAANMPVQEEDANETDNREVQTVPEDAAN